MICLIIKMLTAQWFGLREVGGGCRLQMQSACLMAAKNSAQNLNVTARTEQIKCVNYGAIFSGKNIKQREEKEGEEVTNTRSTYYHVSMWEQGMSRRAMSDGRVMIAF